MSPVARKVWQHISASMPAFSARRRIMRQTDAVHRQRRQRAAMPIGGAEQGSPFRAEQPGRMHVGVEIGFEIVMRRHLMDLAAFFVEAHPPDAAIRAGAREAMIHGAGMR